LLLALSAQAQQATRAPVEPPSVSAEPTTLDTVRALRPEEEVLDLDGFQNPITVEPNRFNDTYDTGISPEQMALDPRYNGYVNYGINQGLRRTWDGIKQVTGMRPEQTPATARPPPPLDEAQARRAIEASERGEHAAGTKP
jgi:hypothetical protein